MKLENLTLTCKTAVSPKDNGFIEGYASTYNQDQVGDIIVPGAFDKVLERGQTPLMFFNHNQWDLPIGKWTEMAIDEKGLYMKGQLNLELDEAKNIYSALKFGSMNGLSVGMLLSLDDIEETEDARFIKSVHQLLEVSVVALPCNLEAEITRVKSLEEITTIKDFERALRDVGASKKEAMILISQAKQLFKPLSDSAGESNILARLNAIAQKSENLNNH